MPVEQHIWYALKTYAGYEKKVKRYLEHRKLTLSAGDCIFRIEIPLTIMGYVLVEALPGERARQIARNIPGVSGIEQIERG